MVYLARAMKDAQQDEKHCYHCSSPDDFIWDCLLVTSARKELNLNCKEGMAPLGKVTLLKVPQDGTPKA